jgi:hypothetical protein
MMGKVFLDRDSRNRDKIEGDSVVVVNQKNYLGNFFRIRSIMVSGGT